GEGARLAGRGVGGRHHLAITAFGLSVVLAGALVGTAAADPGDGINSTDGSTSAIFHTASCMVDATFHYLDANPGEGGPFYAGTQLNPSRDNQAWCRFGVSITFRKDGKNGPMVTTPIIWDARTAEIFDKGLRCTTTHYISRPGEEPFSVTLRNDLGC